MYLTPIIACMVKGILRSCQQVPPVEVMLAVSRVSGRLLSEMLSGDLSDVLKARGEMESQFEKAIQSAKIHGLPPTPQQMTAVK
jgi:hypothetical protein